MVEGRGSRVTSRGSRVNGKWSRVTSRGSKNSLQLFLNVVKSNFGFTRVSGFCFILLVVSWWWYHVFFSLEFPTKATKGKRKRDRKFNTIKQLTVLKRTLKQDLSSNFL